MPKASLQIPKLLDQLESFYGKQEVCWPTDPYLFLVWWHCGYPASDKACTKGWESLKTNVGTDPDAILAARPVTLAKALIPGGMVPELRAERLKKTAARAKDEFGGDLRAALVGPISRVRKILKSFPGIADPGADRIVLFAGIQPVAAVPSNCTGVLSRIRTGREEKNYVASYRAAQQAIEAEVLPRFDDRVRAYLLFKRHGQDTCKRTNPKCPQCPVRSVCAFVKTGQSRTTSDLSNSVI